MMSFMVRLAYRLKITNGLQNLFGGFVIFTSLFITIFPSCAFAEQTGTVQDANTLIPTGNIMATRKVGSITYLLVHKGVERYQNTSRINFLGELWKTDGTTSGTLLLKSFRGAMGLNLFNYAFSGVIVDLSSNDTLMTEMNGQLFFRASTNNNTPLDDSDDRVQIWKSDGTPEGTVVAATVGAPLDIYENREGMLYGIETTGGSLLFGFNGELWKSNGTQSGTALLKDICIRSCFSFPSRFTRVGNRVYFVANNSSKYDNYELWISDGTSTGTRLVRDICPKVVGGPSGGPTQLTAVRDKLFFLAAGVGQNQVWKSDGTTSGTSVVRGFAQANDFLSYKFIEFNGMLIFSANDKGNDIELWKSDGTATGTRLVMDINQGATGSFPNDFTKVNNKLLFTARDLNNRNLWTTDGTPSGTAKVFDFVATGQYPINYTNFSAIRSSGSLATISTFRRENAPEANRSILFITDGTTSGTYPRLEATGVADVFFDQTRILGENLLFETTVPSTLLQIELSD